MKLYFADTIFSPIFRRYFFYFDSYPLVIQIAIILTTIAITATIIAYGSILYRRYSGWKRDRRLAKLNPRIDDLITDTVILNEELALGTPPEKIELDLSGFARLKYRDMFVRQALIDRIMHYRKNFVGDLGYLLRQLYIDLDLEKDSVKKLKSPQWNKKVQGLVELTALDMQISDVNILPLTNSKNRELRAEARHAYIKLSKNEPFKFFDIATEPLLMWDQIELFKIITTNKDIVLPNFARWVTYSNNKSIVSFCLKLIIHYNQTEAIPAVIKLLDNRDHYLRADAIQCLGKLKVEEAEDKLVSIYNNQPLNCQIEILKALGRIGSGRHLEFLKSEFIRSQDFDIRKNAARSIIKHGALSQNMLGDLMSVSSEENQLILKHCMNPLIKY
ncbi:MAG TPA: hypothetical protein DCL43_13450 [Chitinophagaceae bacterium]|jgi:hypothetical protein|nr:hypothetical protein [Chitinophagaceae bacterium]HAN38295.1 hypothetical protein [Chitinophagaceae bacterium]